jgi:nucleotide-binding universal stress UspA family protein
MQFIEDGTHNILLAVDFSQPSKRSFDAALRMARVFGATLNILHVDEEEALFGGHDSDDVTHFLSDIAKRRSDWMESFENTASELGIDANSILRDGKPAEVILEVADEVNAGMIVMGTQGTRGLSSVLQGSVAKKVLRRAERPVLVISRHAGVAPAESGGTFEHVVYPTDFSEASRSGLRLAELFARRTKANLTLVNVLKMPKYVPAGPGQDPIPIPKEIAGKLRQDLESQMETLVAELDSTNVNGYVAINSNPADGIADMAKQEGVDLIMVPRHSKHGVSTYFFGRTAEDLAKIAPVPVLLFTPRKPKS